MEFRKELNVVDNPFDVIFQATVEMARACNLLAVRYKHPELSSISMDETCLDGYLERVQENFKLLSQMNDDEIMVCRESAYTWGRDESTINDFLFNLYKDIPTRFSQTEPRYPDDFERARFGVESEEYKRRRQLDELMKTDLTEYSKDDFYRAMDCISNGIDFCVKTWNWDANAVETVNKLLGTYNFSEAELEYIITNWGKQNQ